MDASLSLSRATPAELLRAADVDGWCTDRHGQH